MSSVRHLLIALLLAAVSLSAQRGGGLAKPAAAGPPFSPPAALKTFRLGEDFQIELFAAEPLISDPVAMEIDEDGRLYVVEMHGYPLDVGGSGRVVLLDDTDGNGTPDRSRVFADKLRLPTGIMRWKNGVIVTDSPEVWYFEDSNGDGAADVRRLLLTGFALTNPQHTTNAPLYGLDNWIYLANEGPVRTIRYGDVFGDAGSPVHFPDRPDGPRLPPNADGRNVRFRPDTFELEMLSARSQFGQTFDAWGRHFLNTNNRHLYHEVIAARYLARNRSLVVPTTIEQVPDYRQPAEVFAITENPRVEMLTDVGVMTAACGVTYYLADLFPSAYRRATFVAEGAHNLVHVASVRDHGATFRASRMHDGREFLASTDPWFRPVNFYIGPDGALYLLDYYRKLFEHPEWMDEATAKSPDLYAGKDRGRIYRIVPRGTPAPTWMGRTRLSKAPVDELVRRLSEPNIWWRRHAQRLLVDRKPAGADGPLIAVTTVGESPVGRVHALWSLDGIGQLTDDVIVRALNDSAAGVRENAIRLAEKRLVSDPSSVLVPALVAMKGDADPKVRLQLLLTLGFVDTPAAQTVRSDLLITNVEDDWMQIAALSAARVSGLDLLRAIERRMPDKETPGWRSLYGRIGTMVAASGDVEVARETLRSAIQPGNARMTTWWQGPMLAGFASGLRPDARRNSAFDVERAMLAAAAMQPAPAPLRGAILDVLERLGLPPGAAAADAIAQAERYVPVVEAGEELRVAAVRVLALAGADRFEPQLRAVLSRADSAAVQIAAVRALGDVSGDRPAATFLELWPRWTPAVRDEAVRAFMREPGRIRMLVDAVSAGRIQRMEIDRPLRIRLMMQQDEQLRTRARALFAESPAAATAALKRYAKVAGMRGDATRGAEVFGRACSMCHQYRGASGSPYGPDVGEVRNRTTASLLTDILNPNHSIADGYELWMVQLADGTTIGGVVGAETPTSVTFRMPAGMQKTVARSDIVSMQIANASAMPERLEAQITLQQMADLVAFIRGR